MSLQRAFLRLLTIAGALEIFGATSVCAQETVRIGILPAPQLDGVAR